MAFPKVIFVHGAGGGAWEWAFWRAVFEQRGWETFAADLLPSARGVAATQVDDYVGQITSWIGQASDSVPPFVVGASMAGPLVLKAMPSVVVSGAVFVNALPVIGVADWPQAHAQFPDIIPWAAKGLAMRSLKKMVDYDESAASLVTGAWRDESGAVLNALYRGLDVEQPSCPTLVVSGCEDRDIPAVLGNAMAQYLSADLMIFQNVSHLGILFGYRAASVANVVAGWMETLVMNRKNLGRL